MRSFVDALLRERSTISPEIEPPRRPGKLVKDDTDDALREIFGHDVPQAV